MRRPTILCALGLATTVFPAATSASVLCRTRANTLVVRDSCKRAAQVITPEQQVDVGLRGPKGPSGSPGPSVSDLKVLDSTGREVGIVTSLGYYGSASVVGTLAVPGASGPGFYLFSVDGQGIDTRSSSCADTDLQYFRSRDCTGDAFASCDYGNCSSVSGAFLARPLYAQDAGTVCYVGDSSEFQRGDFYQRSRLRGSSPDDVTTRCLSGGGRLLEAPAPCGRKPKRGYCASCCRAAPNVGVSPVHTIDASVVGIPPFRLSR